MKRLFDSIRPPRVAGGGTLLAALLLILTVLSTHAADVTWTNLAGGNWSDAINWAGGAIPGPGDRALLTQDGTYTVNLNVDATVLSLVVGGASGKQTLVVSGFALTLLQASSFKPNAELDLHGGSLGGAGSVSVAGTFNLGAYSTLAGNGAVNANGPLTIDTSQGYVTLDGSVLNVGAGAVWSGTNGGLYLEHGAVIRNLAGSTFTIQGDSPLGHSQGLPGTFDNEGAMRKTGGLGNTVLYDSFDNNGSVEVLSGELSFAGGSVHNGSLVSAPGAKLNFWAGGTNEVNGRYKVADSTTVTYGGVVDFNPTATLVSPGTNVSLLGGVANFNTGRPVATTNLVLLGGTLGGGDAFTVNGPMQWRPGASIAGSGTGDIFGPALIDTTNYIVGLDGRSLSFHAGATWQGGGGGIYLQNGAVLNNLAGSTFTITDDGVVSQWGGAPSVFNNAGILRKIGGSGSTIFYDRLNNSGSFEVLSGRLGVDGGGSLDGSLVCAPGTSLNFGGGTTEVNGSIDVTDSTTFTWSTVNFNATAKVVNLGRAVNLPNGTANFNTGRPVALSELALTGGTIGGGDDITVNGPMRWAEGGYMVGSGPIFANGPLWIQTTNQSVSIEGRVLNIVAGATWEGSGSAIFFNNGGVVNNLAGSTFTVTGDSVMRQFTGALGAFNNTGVLRKTGGSGATEVYEPFTNSGSVEVLSGTLHLAGRVSSFGSLRSVAGATLDFTGGNADLNGPYQAFGATLMHNSTVNFNDLATLASLDLASTTLGGTGSITVAGTFNLGPYSALAGTGVVNANGPLRIDTDQVAVGLDGGILNIGAGALWTGDGGWIYLERGAEIHNLAGSTFTIEGDSNLITSQGTHGKFDNAGVMRKTGGTGITTFYDELNNGGSLEVLSGQLSFGGGSVHDGSLLCAPGTRLEFRGGTNEINGSYQNDGTLTVTYCVVDFNPSASVVSLGTNVTVLEAVASFNTGKPVATTNLAVVRGILGGGDDFIVNGPMRWVEGGRLVGSGPFYVNGPLSIQTTNNWVAIEGRALNIAAGATWDGPGAGLYLGKGAAVNNLAGSTFVMTSGAVITHSDDQGGVFNNAGTLRQTGVPAGTVIYEPLNNSGSVEVLSGELSLAGGSVHNGSLNFAPGTKLNFWSGTNEINGRYEVADVTSVTYGVVDFNSTATLVSLGTNVNLLGGQANFNTGGPVFTTNLVVTGGTLGGSDPFTVNGPMRWTENGNLIGSGPIYANGPLFIRTTNNSVGIQGRVLNIAAGATWDGTGAAIYFMNGGVVNNLAASTFVINGDSRMLQGEGALGAFNNAGLLRKTGGLGVTEIAEPFTNGGSVKVLSGTLRFTGEFSSSGAVSNAAGTTLEFSGRDVEMSGPYHGSGATVISGGTVNFNAPATLASLDLAYSILGGTGSVSVAGAFTLGAYATLAGTGVVTANGPLRIDTDQVSVALDGSVLNIAAGAIWTGNDGGIYLDHGAVIHNLVGSTFTIEGDGRLGNSQGLPGTFNNSGVMRKTAGTGITGLYDGFNNDGSLEVLSGELDLAGGSVHNGSLLFAPGTKLNFVGGTNEINGRYEVADITTVTYGGVVDFNPTATVVSLGANVNLLGGQANFNTGKPVETANLVVMGGILGGSDPFTVNGPMRWWEGGRLIGAGPIYANGPLSILTTNNSVGIEGRVLNIAAGARWDGTSSGIYFNNGGVVNNLAGSTFVITGDSMMGQYEGLLGAFNNAGTLRKTGGGGATMIYEPFTNSGSVEVLSGTLGLAGNVSSSGPINNAAGTVLDFSGNTVDVNAPYHGVGATVISYGTVNFNAPAALTSLELRNSTLGGTGLVTVAGPLLWRPGASIAGSGTVDIFGPALIDTTNYIVVLDGKSLSFHAGATWQGGGGGIYLQNGAVLNNLAGSTFTITDDGVVNQWGGAPSVFNNAGILRKIGGSGSTIFYDRFNNSGSFEVLSGRLELDGGASLDGSLVCAPGTSLTFGGGTTEVNGSIDVTDSTTFSWSTVNFNSTARVVNLGHTVSLPNGTANFNTGRPVALSDLALTGGTIGGGDDITVNGRMTWGYGAWFTGTGMIDLISPLSIQTTNSSVSLVGRTMNIHAGAAWEGGGGTIYLFDGATMNNLTNSVFTVSGACGLSQFQGAPAAFYNDGVVQRLGPPASLEVYLAFHNRGRLEARPSIWNFWGGLDLAATSVLDLFVGGHTPGVDFAALNSGWMTRLSGTLNITLTNGFAPVPDDSFRLMNWNAQNGGFTRETGLDLGNGNFFQAICDFGGLSLVAKSASPPVAPVQTNLVDQFVALGDNAYFSLTPVGPPPLAFQWQFQGTNLPGQNTPSLSVPKVQPRDAGLYCLWVVDASGWSNVFCASLAALRPPVITNQPVSVSITNESQVVFNVMADGDGPFRYQWRLNGANILDATNSSYTIYNPQSVDGGTYDAIVANPARAVLSTNAVLRVFSARLPFADNLADRGTTNSLSGVGNGSNLNATREVGEPFHALKGGTNSVWLQWTAPTNGVATFSTRGSSFDTLLAIYTGTTFADLAVVAADDDRGGHFTSEVVFNARAGTNYLVAIDGFSGARGDIVLTWNLDTNLTEAPRMVEDPLPFTAALGGNAIFTALAASSLSLTYQWYQNCCLAIPDATNTTLIITNIGPLDIGTYRVEATTSRGGTVRSADAFLEIGPRADAHSFDKLDDLIASQSPHPRLNRAGGGLHGGGIGGVVFPSVSAGGFGSQLINNFNSTTDQLEPIHDNTIGGASRWFQITPTSDGFLMLDTLGSDIPTILDVSVGTDYLTLRSVITDANRVPAGPRSRVVFPAQRGVNYLVSVDGVGGVQGSINLNWQLGVAPGTNSVPASPVVVAGSALVLQAGIASAAPPPAYQWRLNGVDIPHATNSSYTLPGVQFAQRGVYTVVASNFAGSITNTVATLAVQVPFHLEPETALGVTRFRAVATAPQPVVLSLSTNLNQWNPLFTNRSPDALIFYLDDGSAQRNHTFYRLVPWP